jgi:hypothetical protein
VALLSGKGAVVVGTIEGALAGSMRTCRVEVDPVGDSAESGADTMTVGVDVAVRPDWSVTI